MKVFLFEIVLLICLIEESLAGCQKSKMKLRVRTSRFDKVPQDSYIHVPISIRDHGIEQYENVELEETFPYPLKLYCLCGDPKFCLFFDKMEDVAGIQISYPKADVAEIDPNIYNFSNPNYIETCFYDTPAYSVRMYLTDPERLSGDRRNRTSPAEFEGLWTVLDGELVRYAAKCQPNSPVIANGEFSMQGCTPGAGLAYVRRFDENSSCNDGFFLYMLYAEGNLVGFGHFIPGLLSPGPSNKMFNNPNGPGLDEVVPYPPPCMKEMEKYGLTSLNIFIVEDPWNIRCPKCLCNSE